MLELVKIETIYPIDMTLKFGRFLDPRSSLVSSPRS